MHLAARFCAKEAVAKALGLRGVELPRRGGGGGRRAAAVRLGRAAAERAAELGVEAVGLADAHRTRLAGAVALLR